MLKALGVFPSLWEVLGRVRSVDADKTLFQNAAPGKRTQGLLGQGSPNGRSALLSGSASSQSDGITGRLISAVWDAWDELPARRDELAGSDIYTLRRIVPEDRDKNWSRGQ